MATVRENFIDSDTGLVTLRKKPSESKLLDIDVTKYIRSGDTVAAISSIVSVGQGKVAGSVPVTVSNSSHDNNQLLQAIFAAGTDQENYLITSTFTTAGGDTLEVDTMLWVRETF